MTQLAYDISVIICAYTEDRWDDLVAAVTSVQQQTLAAREIIVVIDHNPRLLRRVQGHLQGVAVVENKDVRGLRGARNSGIAVARGEFMAFLDDDAVAMPDWLLFLCAGYADPRVLGTGGTVTPSWTGVKPDWLPEEFYWVIGCSYRGMPEAVQPVRNPIGANMSLRRGLFDMVGNFNSQNRHVGPKHAGGCEETELCIRARQHQPECVFLYQPRALVLHRVPGSRTSWHYFCSRCYVEGLAKAVLARSIGVKDSLSSERSYTFQTLPQGIIRGLTDTLFHHDPGGLIRAAAIVVGLAVTTMGYLAGSTFVWVATLKDAVSRKKAHYGSKVGDDIALERKLPR